ncbi:hypothetical protein ACQPUZ_15425 [Clostridium tertium]
MKYARFRLRENDVITFEEGNILEVNKRRNEIILTEFEAIEKLIEAIESKNYVRVIGASLIENLLGIDLVPKKKEVLRDAGLFSSNSKYPWYDEAREVKIGLNDGEKIVSGDTIKILEDNYNEIVFIIKDGKIIGTVEDMEYGGDDSLIDCLDAIGYELSKMGLLDVTIWYRELQ